MIESYILNHPWLPTLIWCLLYIGDYNFTIIGARLYRAQKIVEFDGSYELTPEYQNDIDNLRKFSWTSLMWTIYGVVLLLATGYISISYNTPQMYGVLVGVFLVPELYIHTRHVGNILDFKRMGSDSPDIIGHIRHGRKSLYIRSSRDAVLFGIYTLIAFALTGSFILLGGTFALLGMARKHWSLSKKQKPISANESD
jgi:hypothetical protein